MTSMERTELREAFFAEVARDPWLAALTTTIVDHWALGYEQALKDLFADGAISGPRRYEHSFSDLRRKAQEAITDRNNEAQAKAIVAMAQIMRDPKPFTGGFSA